MFIGCSSTEVFTSTFPSFDEIYSTKYTEPQKKYLENLKLYRDVMWEVFPELNIKKNPKAKPLTLRDFEEFAKYANEMK